MQNAMNNLRKWSLTVISLISYSVIMVINHQVEPMALGLGLGFLLTPAMAANAMEHRYKNQRTQ